MGNKDFDRQVIAFGEKPNSTDHNKIMGYAERAIRAFIQQAGRSRVSISDPSGVDLAASFMGDSFRVVPGTGMEVVVHKGLGFRADASDEPSDIGSPDILGVDDLNALKPLVLDANATIAVPAANASNPRIDIVEVKVDRRLTDADSRLVFDDNIDDFAPKSVDKLLTWAVDGDVTVNGSGGLNYKTGTPAGSPTAPAADTGYVVIAQVKVPANATSIVEGTGANDGIIDLRKLRFPYNLGRVSLRVEVATSGGAAVTLQDLIAPPGVKVAVNQSSSTEGSFTVYIFAGGAVTSAVPTCIPLRQSSTAIWIPGTSGAMDVSGTIDATDQDKVRGVTGSTDPAIDVARGQPRIKQPFTIVAVGGVALSGPSDAQIAIDFSY